MMHTCAKTSLISLQPSQHCRLPQTEQPPIHFTVQLHLCLPKAPMADFMLSPHLALFGTSADALFLPSDERLLWLAMLDPDALRLDVPVVILPSRLDTISIDARLADSDREPFVLTSAATPFSCVFFGGGDDLPECAGLSDACDV
jgi:hypothetical protein